MNFNFRRVKVIILMRMTGKVKMTSTSRKALIALVGEVPELRRLRYFTLYWLVHIYVKCELTKFFDEPSA